MYVGESVCVCLCFFFFCCCGGVLSNFHFLTDDWESLRIKVICHQINQSPNLVRTIKGPNNFN